MTTKEKINLIDSLENSETADSERFAVIRKYVTDDDSFVRSRCACMLAGFRNEESLDLLITLCSDSDSFVRTEAFDTLSEFPCKRAEKLLYKAVSNEPDELARSYAVFSWTEVICSLYGSYGNAVEFLFSILRTEKSERCRLSCYAGIYRLGYTRVLPEILAFMKSENYHIRCLVANVLSGMARREDKDTIMSAVTECLETEETIAVRSSMEDFRKILSEI